MSTATTAPPREPMTHVVILDGTMSSVARGYETNAGLLWKLLAGSPATNVRIFYEPGIQWRGVRNALEVMAGIGINRQIRRVYRWLALGWRPGDRVYLFGYSRGAYGVRSLAGVIDQHGLLRPEQASMRNTEFIYSYYRERRASPFAPRFSQKYCWEKGACQIEMIGVWDTVKALGFRWPLIWHLAPNATEFHNDQLSSIVKRGYHALARDERRAAFSPVLWRSKPGWKGQIEQVWFRGTHGDVGGQLSGFMAARPLANGPLVWILGKAQNAGLKMPEGWADAFPIDEDAPSVGMNNGFGRLFVTRRARVIGADPSERMFDGSPVPMPRAPYSLLHKVKGWARGFAYKSIDFSGLRTTTPARLFGPFGKKD